DLESSLEDIRNELMEEKAKTKSLLVALDKAQNDYESTEKEKKNLKRELSKAMDKLADLEKEISIGMDALTEKNLEIDRLARAHQSMQADFSSRIEEMSREITDRDEALKELEMRVSSLNLAKENAHYQILSL